MIEGLFGVDATLSGSLSAVSHVDEFDPAAELHNLHFQGRMYNVTRRGVIVAG